MTQDIYKHWQVEKDDKHILWAYLDKQQEAVNSINTEVLKELDAILSVANRSKGLIIASKKTTGFIAGADIKTFSDFNNVQIAMEFIHYGVSVLNKIEALSIPTVAMISGFCLGGGLELALACTYRIADDDPKTKLGLPEVLLGIHPGWGGTLRLPRLIGAPAALDLILTGRAVSASAAKKMGFVDEVVPKRHIERAAQQMIIESPAPHKPTFSQQSTNSMLVRPLIAHLTRKKLNHKIKEKFYPAPFAVVNNWERFGVSDAQSALRAEAQSIEAVLRHPTAMNLIRVYELQERLKRFAKATDVEFKHIHVIGGGTMGGDIAAWCALKGYKVTLQDRDAKFLSPAFKRAHELFAKKLKKPRLIQQALDNLMPDIKGRGIATADIIIEAIYENLEAKQTLFKDIEAKAKKSALLATNTSSFPLDEINQLMQAPQRLVGIHFFNPVAKMQLVEVVTGDQTDKMVLNQALSFVGKIGKLPLPTTSTPGFLVNRILTPYLMESMALVNEGINPALVDKAAIEFGMPMGPVELADAVGLDICLSVAEHLKTHFNFKIPEQLKEMVANKKLGKKTQSGFYEYKKGKPIKPKIESEANITDIMDRLVLRILNEAVACVREGVVEDKDLVDVGMIFGAGFAPFTGGPIHYLEHKGAKNIHDQLLKLKDHYGERFNPDLGWDAFATVPKEDIKEHYA